MILALNIENTDITLGCIDGSRILFTSRMAADRKKSIEEYAIGIRSILEMHKVTPNLVEASIISSVVPALINTVRDGLRMLLGHDPIIVGPGVKTGLNIRTENPAALGCDLVVNAVGAIAAYKTPLIVVDLNSATTFLHVDEAKRLTGSVIAPGVAISMSALAQSCDQLPRITIEAPDHILGRNTIDSMKAGVILGTASMIDGVIDRIEAESGNNCTLIASGRYADEIIPHCSHEIILDSVLQFKGMSTIYDKNALRR